jgi:hypothetical protein
MTSALPFLDFAFGDLLNSVLPDFILSFTFFTAVVYAVLSKRFGEQRPAVAMSAALGMALSIGLVWWEYANGYSIRDLGPLAVGFAIIILAGVIYQSIRGVGGNWAGAGIAIGACLLIGWTLGLDRHFDRSIIQSLITVLLTAGVIAFLLHRHGAARGTVPAWSSAADLRHDMSDLYQDERVAHNLNHDLKHLKREARHLAKHPDEDCREASDIMLQLRRILPAEGWLTQRMAGLRAKAELTRQGDIARVLQSEAQLAGMPAAARKRAGEQLARQYAALGLDGRLVRLDKAVAENELRIRNLTQQAQQNLQAGNYPALANVLEQASKLQKHNAHLFKLIKGTEARLIATARQLMKIPRGEKSIGRKRQS